MKNSSWALLYTAVCSLYRLFQSFWPRFKLSPLTGSHAERREKTRSHVHIFPLHNLALTLWTASSKGETAHDLWPTKGKDPGTHEDVEQHAELLSALLLSSETPSGFVFRLALFAFLFLLHLKAPSLHQLQECTSVARPPSLFLYLPRPPVCLSVCLWIRCISLHGIPLSVLVIMKKNIQTQRALWCCLSHQQVLGDSWFLPSQSSTSVFLSLHLNAGR